MFGSTLGIVGLDKTVIDGRADRALAEYVRWEYLPADRSRVLLALKDGQPRSRRRLGDLVRDFRFRRAAARAERGDRRRAGHGVRRPLRPIETLEPGLLYRAFP